MASIAQFYSDNLAREVIKGSVTKAELGGTPNKAPIGYLNVRQLINGREARVVEIDPERGPLMAWALTEMALRPRPIRTLHAEVTDKGLRTIPGPKRPAKPRHRVAAPSLPAQPVLQGPRHPPRRDLRRDPPADRSAALREHIHNGLSARRADAELERRHQHTLLTQLDHQSRKLLQAHYDDAIPPDLFKSEQPRITRDMETANARLAALDQVFADIEETLDRALRLGQNCHHAYTAARPHVRRLMNQAFFEHLYISDEDTVRSDLAEPFAILLGDELTAEAEAALAQTAKNPPPNTGTTGPTSTSEPHTQDVKGLNKARLVGGPKWTAFEHSTCP